MKWPRKFYDMELALLSLLLIGGCAWFSSKIDAPTNAGSTKSDSARPTSATPHPSPTSGSESAPLVPSPTKTPKPKFPREVQKATFSPTSGDDTPTSSPIPTENPGSHSPSLDKVAPVTLARWGNAAHTVQACTKPYAGYCACALPYRPIWQSSLGYGCVLTFNWKWKDGVTRLTFRADSTRHYVTPPGFPKAPDVCEPAKDPPFNTWCKGRDWDTLGPIWKVSGIVSQAESNPYQRFIRYKSKLEIFVKTQPPKPDMTSDGIEVPCKPGGCGFTRKITTP